MDLSTVKISDESVTELMKSDAVSQIKELGYFWDKGMEVWRPNAAKIPYKFNERPLINELHDYIDSTYTQHYGGQEGKKIQVTEFIMEHCDSFDFLKGNIIKYAARYGKKDGYNRKDILKSLHYGLIMLCYHDRKSPTDEDENFVF